MHFVLGRSQFRVILKDTRPDGGYRNLVRVCENVKKDFRLPDQRTPGILYRFEGMRRANGVCLFFPMYWGYAYKLYHIMF